MRKLLVFLLFAGGFFLSTSANNISLQKISLADTNRVAKTVKIKMNLSWQNSWRDSINWDAAWIIMKYKGLNDSIYKWKPVRLSQSGNDPGTGNALMKIVVPDDRVGAFVYRKEIGEGHISVQDLSFFWDYGADGVVNIDSVELRVFACEMVYIPEGAFAIGDGNGTSRSYHSFQQKLAPNNYVLGTEGWSPLVNTSNSSFHSDDNILVNNGIRISGLKGLDINGDKVADYPQFPTGYKAFYCMKYEVSQGQYADFLNTLCLKPLTGYNYYYNDTNYYKKVPLALKRAWQSLYPYFNYDPAERYRNTLYIDTVQIRITVSRPDRAYGAMSSTAALSFADWFGLRPMSELEFEKAARGPLRPALQERAWGDDKHVFAEPYYVEQVLQLSGLENGTETFSNYTIHKRHVSQFKGGDGGNVPHRVGIFATDTTSRISSGASYFGVMDFSKNVYESVISLGTQAGRQVKESVHGDGWILVNGQSDVYPGLEPSALFVYRGNTVSERHWNSTQGYMGFRAVRNAPADN